MKSIIQKLYHIIGLGASNFNNVLHFNIINCMEIRIKFVFIRIKWILIILNFIRLLYEIVYFILFYSVLLFII